MMIRQAHERDLDDIAQIETENSSVPWSRESIRKNLAGENGAYNYVAAQDDGEIIGYAAMWIVVDDAQIMNISVKKQWRRKGIGDALLVSLIADAKKYGARLLSLEVSEYNRAAICLYQKHRFNKRGIRKGYYGKNGGDAIIMLRNIENEE